MPLSTKGIRNIDSEIDRTLAENIDRVFTLIDEKLDEFSQARGLTASQIRFLQPLHCCVFVGNTKLSVVLAPHDISGISRVKLIDFSNQEMDIDTAYT